MTAIIQRALLSVSDKTDIIPFAKMLHDLGITLLSTGGTARTLQNHNVPIQEVSEFTGFPEMMDGRVKTLHPKIHGGILGRRDVDFEVMQKHDIHDIDLVVVNLYPFEETIRNPQATLQDAIEQIDIGGPSLIRAAAKNYDWVTVVVDPKDYTLILNELKETGKISTKLRFKLAAKAFSMTAHYDGVIANHLSALDTQGERQAFSQYLHCDFILNKQLRYGENPQQSAAFYSERTSESSALSHAEQIQGKALSYNNLQDAETGITCCYQFDQPSCIIVKHANPCGAATAPTLLDAYTKAFACDPTSSFGGIIAFNQTVDKEVIQAIYKNQFLEVLIAPHFTQDAIEEARRKSKVILLSTGTNTCTFEGNLPDLKRVRGGLLMQQWDTAQITPKSCQVVTKLAPSLEAWDDLIFAEKICKYVKSNAIVIAKNGQTLGIGAGQMSRVFSVEIAHEKAQDAKLDLKHSILASDAFFPFKDGVELAAKFGIKHIIQPGGSIRDEEVIAACDQLGISMVFTDIRHFRH